MGFNTEDRVRELERIVREQGKELARLPTRPPSPQLRPSMIRCQAFGAASGSSFNVDNVVLLSGIDPRGDPDDSNEVVAIDNPASLSFDDNAILYCYYNEDAAKWEPLNNTAGMGSSMVDVIHFTLTADLSLATTSAAATITSSTIGSSGSTTVYDEEAKFSALTGYKGYAYDDGTQYRILTMEGPARFADFEATADSSTSSETITGDIEHLWGNPPNGKAPASETGVTVYKTPVDDNATARYAPIRDGDKFRAAWDEDEGKWKLFWYPGLRITVRKSTTAGVTSGTTFTLTDPELVNGLFLPKGDITVQREVNSAGPDIYKSAGSPGYLYARYNASVGTTPDTNWDAGDAGNYLWLLQGIGSYDPSKTQVILQDADDDPEWTDTEEIDVITEITSITVVAGVVTLTYKKGTYKVVKEVTAPATQTVTHTGTSSCP